jgi:VRR-NUC domain
VTAKPAELERDFQTAVVDAARLGGWRVAHFRAARTRHGWRTPVAADGAGFPDLVLVRGAQLVAAELKSARGKVTREQAEWLDALDGAGVAVYVWRPADWDEVVEVLA